MKPIEDKTYKNTDKNINILNMSDMMYLSKSNISEFYQFDDEEKIKDLSK